SMYFVISTAYLQVTPCTLSFQQRTYKSLHVLCHFNNVLTSCFMYFVISTTYLQVASCTLSIQQRTYHSLHVLCRFNNVLTTHSMDVVNLTTYLPKYLPRTIHNFFYYFSCRLLFYNRAQILSCPERHILAVTIYSCGTSDTFRCRVLIRIWQRLCSKFFYKFVKYTACRSSGKHFGDNRLIFFTGKKFLLISSMNACFFTR